MNLLLYVATVVIWGTTWIAIKYQLGVVAPEVSIAYRFALAAAILFAWALARGVPLRFGLRDHLVMALLGCLIFSTNFLLFYLATEHLTTGLSAVIFSTSVVMNIVNSALFLGRKVESRVLIGAAFGMGGIATVFWSEIAGFSLGNLASVSLLLALGGTLSFSLGNILSARNQAVKLPLMPSTAFGMAYGAAFMALVALLRGSAFTFDPALPYVISLGYLAVFGSVVAFGCYLLLLGRIGVARAAYATVLFPIIALGISTLFEDFHWTAPALIGVGLILFGNVIVLAKLRPVAPATPPLVAEGGRETS